MLKPINKLVIIKKLDDETTTESGLIISGSDKKQTLFRGEVISYDDSYEYDYNVGDTVLFSPINAQNIKDDDGQELLIMNFVNILAVVE